MHKNLFWFKYVSIPISKQIDKQNKIKQAINTKFTKIRYHLYKFWTLAFYFTNFDSSF